MGKDGTRGRGLQNGMTMGRRSCTARRLFTKHPSHPLPSTLLLLLLLLILLTLLDMSSSLEWVRVRNLGRHTFPDERLMMMGVDDPFWVLGAAAAAASLLSTRLGCLRSLASPVVKGRREWA